MLERCGRSSKINTYKLNRRTSRCYWLMLRSTSQSSLISCFPGINTRGGMKQLLRIWRKGAALKYFKGNTARKAVGRAWNTAATMKRSLKSTHHHERADLPGLSPLSLAASQVYVLHIFLTSWSRPRDIPWRSICSESPKSSKEKQRRAWLGSYLWKFIQKDVRGLRVSLSQARVKLLFGMQNHISEQAEQCNSPQGMNTFYYWVKTDFF